MHLLITGAAGFIGSKVCELALSKGYSVIGVDNINSYYDTKLKKMRLKLLKNKKDFVFVKLDIENKAALARLFQSYKISGVINLAARAGVRYSMEKPEVYFRTNVMGTLNILECMRQFGVDKIVLASTSSLYSGQNVPYKEDMNTDKPLSPYAASKKAAEALLYTYHHLYGIKGVVLRFFTVYGPAGRPDMSYFRFIKLIKDGKPINIYGDGTQRRDFTYVDDIASGTLAAYENDGLDFEIINLGNNNPVELIYVVSILEQLLGKKAIIKYSPFHKADMFETCADITKAFKLLGWKPQTKIEDGLKKTVDWYIEHETVLKDLSLEEGDERNPPKRVFS